MNLKSFISVAISALCISLAGAVTAFAEEAKDENYSGYSLGDVNSDEDIDSTDASEILGYYAILSTEQPEEWTQEQIWVSDVNSDNIVDSMDATIILSYYSYSSTFSEDSVLMDFTEYIENPPVTEPPVTTTTTTTVTTTVTTTTTEAPMTTRSNYCRAPEGLDPGEEGSIEYIINTAELKERDCIRMYNIKPDNGHNGDPVENTSLIDYLTEDKIKVLNDFAKENFTDDMTNYDRLEYTWKWLHFNVQYADGKDGRPEYTDIWNLSYAEACFVKKAGQCLQYNGAFAEMMAYMGYDAYMVELYTSGQHFRPEVSVNGVAYGIEVGETEYDNPPWYYWMWLFDSSEAHISSRP